MAQRKSSPSGKPGRPGGKPGAARSAAGKATSTSKTTSAASSKSAASRPAAANRVPGTPPARKKKPKSIVNQKQTPWGLIITTALVVLFAIGVVAVVVATKKDSDEASGAVSTTTGGQKVDTSGKNRYRLPELPAAAAIKGVTYRVEGQSTHVPGRVKYDRTPPIGGNHSQYWADCTGTVYPKAIANENAVHMLEHGAVWIAYNADDVKGADLDKLKSYVSGIDRMAMSPYPNLSTPISLQAWGYQLKVSSASDPRIAQFIKVLKFNQTTTPEPNATCSQPTFKESPSTFNNPKDQP